MTTTIQDETHRSTAGDHADLVNWTRRIAQIPDLRWELVRSAHRTIRLGRYEDERILDRTVRAMGNDIGVLCRRADRPGVPQTR